MKKITDDNFKPDKSKFKENTIEYFLSDRYKEEIRKVSKESKLKENELDRAFKARLFDYILDNDIDFFENQVVTKEYIGSQRYMLKVEETAKRNWISKSLVETNFKAKMFDDAIKWESELRKKNVSVGEVNGVKYYATFTQINNTVEPPPESNTNTEENKPEEKQNQSPADTSELISQITSAVRESIHSELDAIKNETISSREIIDEVMENLKNEKMDLSTSILIKNSEIREYFLNALQEAKEEIDIVSPWIGKYALDSEVMSLFESALKRKVTIKIVYGISDSKSNGRNDNRGYDKNEITDQMVKAMKNKFNKYGNLFRVQKSNTHAKILICDSSYYIMGSMNLLSFNPGYNDELHSEAAEYRTNKINLEMYRKRYFNF